MLSYRLSGKRLGIMNTRYMRGATALTPYTEQSARERQERQAQRAAETRRRNRATYQTRARKYYAEGLDHRGQRYTVYTIWKAAHTRATRAHDSARVHILETQYPKFARQHAEEQTPLAQAGARIQARTSGRQRNALHLARRREYRREDILSGDYPLTSYRQFSYHYHAAIRSHDAEMVRYLSRHYHTWLHKLSASDTRVTEARKEARRVYKNVYDRAQRRKGT